MDIVKFSEFVAAISSNISRGYKGQGQIHTDICVEVKGDMMVVSYRLRRVKVRYTQIYVQR